MKKPIAIALPELETALHDLHAKYFDDAPVADHPRAKQWLDGTGGDAAARAAELLKTEQGWSAEDQAEYFGCLYAMAKRGDEAFLQATTHSLRSGDPKVIARACFVLGHSGEQRAVPMLMHVLEQNNGLIIGDVIWALGMIKDARAIHSLHKLWVRGVAPEQTAQALARLGFLDSLPFLVIGLFHPSTRVRLFTAGAMASIVSQHDPDDVRTLWAGLIPRVEPALQDVFVPVRVLAACILAQLGRPFSTLELRTIFEMRVEPTSALQGFFVKPKR